MNDLISVVLEYLNKGEDVVIATIVDHQGSSPRSSGAKMVVDHNGTIFGTIGGGLMEAGVIKKASSLFKTRKSGIIRYDLTPKDLDTMGMICGGRVEILLDLVLPSKENLKVLSNWQEALKNTHDRFFITIIPDKQLSAEKVFRCLMTNKGMTREKFPLSSSAESQIKKIAQTLKMPRLTKIEDSLVLIEPTIIPKKLYIFGAGHVAVPTAGFAAHVGFDVVVVDDRKEFADPKRFPGNINTRVIPDFNHAFSGITVSEDDFIVIITRGHLYDKIVLAQALKTNAAYFGMIGSKRKRDTIYDALLEEGYSLKDINRVKCPIGIFIGAETPEEIAVSIVAELIQKRAGLN